MTEVKFPTSWGSWQTKLDVERYKINMMLII